MFRRISLIVLAVVAMFSLEVRSVNADGVAVRYDNHKLVRLFIQSQDQIEQLHDLDLLLMSDQEGVGPVMYIVPPEVIAILDEMGLRYQVIDDNVQKDIDAERLRLATQGPVNPRGGGWFDDFKDLAQVVDKLEAWATDYPDIVELIDIGDSIEGRDIWALRISGPGVNKPAVLFNATQHAREWIAPMVDMYVADHLITQYGFDPDITSLVDALEIYIIPVVNPDGYSYSWTNNRYWRKNRRDNAGSSCYGVDPNRNWELGWGGGGSSGDPCDETYRGTAPFSEPCTQAMRDFYYAHPNLVASIDFHSHGQYILYPWAYQGGGCGDDGIHDLVGSEMKTLIAGVHGRNYTLGSCYDVLYIASGGSVDWTWGDQGVISYTIELRGPDFVIPASEIIPNSEEVLPAAIFLAQWCTSPVTFTFPGGLPVIVNANEETTVLVDISVFGGSPIDPETGKLFYRIGSADPFTESDLTHLGGNSYEGTLLAAPCAAQIQFYFQAETTDQVAYTSPGDAPATFYTTDAFVIEVAFEDDMESNSGWMVGDIDDDATTGIWNRMDPQGTAAQPEDDHTSLPGTDCWVTDGNAGGSIGAYDVDGGKTTLFTPTLLLGDTVDPLIGYWRWYSNTEGSAPNADIFVVDISDDDGSNWANVEIVGPAGAETSGGWYYHEFVAGDFIDLTDQVIMRFIASDEDSGSIIEAAVDDLAIMDVGCPCAGDLTGDNQVNIDDIFAVLGLWGPCADPCPPYCTGDLTEDCTVNIDDIFAILGQWGPCE